MSNKENRFSFYPPEVALGLKEIAAKAGINGKVPDPVGPDLKMVRSPKTGLPMLELPAKETSSASDEGSQSWKDTVQNFFKFEQA